MSTKRNDGGPAFPRPQAETSLGGNFEQDGMSLREYAAIHLRVPNSGTPWLDDMIRQAQRDELAGQALAGMASIALDDGDMVMGWADMAKAAYNAADAMLAAREGGAA